MYAFIQNKNREIYIQLYIAIKFLGAGTIGGVEGI